LNTNCYSYTYATVLKNFTAPELNMSAIVLFRTSGTSKFFLRTSDQSEVWTVWNFGQ
jgi:hypothetical protein